MVKSKRKTYKKRQHIQKVKGRRFTDEIRNLVIIIQKTVGVGGYFLAFPRYLIPFTIILPAFFLTKWFQSQPLLPLRVSYLEKSRKTP